MDSDLKPMMTSHVRFERLFIFYNSLYGEKPQIAVLKKLKQEKKQIFFSWSFTFTQRFLNAFSC